MFALRGEGGGGGAELSRLVVGLAAGDHVVDLTGQAIPAGGVCELPPRLEPFGMVHSLLSHDLRIVARGLCREDGRGTRQWFASYRQDVIAYRLEIVNS